MDVQAGEGFFKWLSGVLGSALITGGGVFIATQKRINGKFGKLHAADAAQSERITKLERDVPNMKELLASQHEDTNRRLEGIEDNQKEMFRRMDGMKDILLELNARRRPS
jgi:hypothetical protein